MIEGPLLKCYLKGRRNSYHITRPKADKSEGVGRERRTNMAIHGSDEMTMPAAEQKKDFASEGFLGPEHYLREPPRK